MNHPTRIGALRHSLQHRRLLLLIAGGTMALLASGCGKPADSIHAGNSSRTLPGPASAAPAASGPSLTASAQRPAAAQRQVSAASVALPGLAQRLQAALVSGDPVAASEVAREMLNCRSSGLVRDGAERLRGRSSVPPDKLKLLIEEFEQTQRDCQQVSAADDARVPDLALAALQGKVEGSATLYADAFGRPEAVPPATHAALREGLVREAAQGRHMAVTHLALYGSAWGLPDLERQVYRRALALSSEGAMAQLAELATGAMATGLSTDDAARVEARAAELAKRIRQR